MTRRRIAAFPKLYTLASVSIDDPIKAVESLIASDERLRSPITDKLVTIAKELRIPGASTLSGLIERRRRANWELLLRTAILELRYLIEHFDGLEAKHKEFLKNDFGDLVVDALSKAERLRAKERVARIALILANAAEVGPSTDLDLTEELMRVATELSDIEVEFLRQMDSFHPYPWQNPGGGLLTVHEANMNWSERHPQLSGVDNSEYSSIALRLQSLGLIEAVEREVAIVGPDITPYRILRKGSAFIRFVRSH
jgi:hypothetical protein